MEGQVSASRAAMFPRPKTTPTEGAAGWWPVCVWFPTRWTEGSAMGPKSAPAITTCVALEILVRLSSKGYARPHVRWNVRCAKSRPSANMCSVTVTCSQEVSC